MKPITLHLTAIETWNRQASGATYLPEGFEIDGFIHCTDGEPEVLAAGNRYYTADPRDYCLLSIETAKLTSPVRYDDDLNIFPHIYGPLNVEAVSRIRAVVRDGVGTFIGVGEEIARS